jgi:DNA primase
MDSKDDIKTKVLVSQVFGRFGKLKPNGPMRFVTCCPIHKEKTASCHIRDDKGYFYCFGCGAGGDVFKFYELYYDVPFHEAVKRLADDFGFKLPEFNPQNKLETDKKNNIYDLLARATDFYHANVSQVEAYLTKKRKLNLQTIKFFKIGFCPQNPKTMLDTLGFTLTKHANLLEEAGLFYKNIPRFGGRLVVPIYNRNNQVVGFGGRILEDNPNLAKYINSAESAVFHKSNILFNFNHASLERSAEILIVEGYFDVIKLHQHGYKNAVAPMGTSMTLSHIELILKINKTPVFLFDTDEAGKKATFRTAKMCLEVLKAGQAAKFIILPREFKDVDELLSNNPNANFRQYECDLHELIWYNLTANVDFKNPNHVAKLEKEIAELVITDKTIQKNYLSFFKDAIFKKKIGRDITRSEVKKQRNKIEIIEDMLLKYLVQNLSYFVENIDIFEEFGIDFTDEANAQKYTQIEEIISQNTDLALEDIKQMCLDTAQIELTYQDKNLVATKDPRAGYEKLCLNHKLAMLENLSKTQNLQREIEKIKKQLENT